MVWGVKVVHQIDRAKEGIAVLMNGVWHSALINFGCVSYRILCVKFNFSGLKCMWQCCMGPM